jgi:hypothetical protein
MPTSWTTSGPGDKGPFRGYRQSGQIGPQKAFLSRHATALLSVISNQTCFLRHVLDGLMVIQRAARRDDEVTVKGTMPAKDSMAAPS